MRKSAQFLIENYAFQTAKAFTIEMVSQYTSVKRTICKRAISKLLDDHKLLCWEIDNQEMYIYNFSGDTVEKQSYKKNMSQSRKTINKVKEYSGSNKFHYQIAEDLGLSRSSVTMALNKIENYPEKMTLINKIKEISKNESIKCTKNLRNMTVDELKNDIINLQKFVNKLIISVEGYQVKRSSKKIKQYKEAAIQEIINNVSIEDVSFKYQLPYGYVTRLKNERR